MNRTKTYKSTGKPMRSPKVTNRNTRSRKRVALERFKVKLPKLATTWSRVADTPLEKSEGAAQFVIFSVRVAQSEEDLHTRRRLQ